MILLGKIALGFAGVALAGVGLVCSEGMIEVNVVEKQPERHHIYVLAPALLAPIGMRFAPKQHMAQASREIQPWLPTIRAALDELRKSDDVTLVEVKGQGQHVRFAKSGGALIVDVENEDETVHVSAPIRAISSSVDELAAAASASQPQP